MPAGLIVALVIGLCEYNTVLNNAYEYCSTLHDSTIFATVMWRSGWLLTLAPALAAHSFFIEHFSPILYVPNLVSYFYPGDRMSYYAIVYAIAYGALGFVAYRLVRDVAPPRFATALGVAAGLALFCSAPVFRGQWEPHMEAVSPVFAILMFRAWQLRQYPACLVWLLCNAALREDLAVIYAIPLALLAGVQYLQLRSRDPALAAERLRRGLILCAVSVACTVAAFAVQKVFFPGYGVFAREYYDPANFFGHLSWPVILGRAARIFAEAQGLWVPLVILAVAAAVFRDAKLLVGAIALVPYALVNFLAKNQLFALLETYKGFPFALVMLWPALVAITRPPDARRRYLWLQAAVLAGGLFGIAGGRAYFIEPDGIGEAEGRWLAQPYTQNAEAYRDFGARLDHSKQLGAMRASRAVIALYPYDFGIWYRSNLEHLDLSDIMQYDTYIWFDDDRDADIVDLLLDRVGIPPKRYRVAGTKIEIATRMTPDQLTDFTGVLQKVPAQ